MSSLNHMRSDDHGAAAIFIAAGMVLFLGMAAMAIDLGLAFNERRADQSAVDSGVMAGALVAVNGGAAARDDALDFVRMNLPTTYTDAEWQALWEGCVDPAADRNEGGTFDFVALTPPAGWTVVDPANWCMSFESARGLYRVRVPNQIVDTTFGRVLGRSSIETAAAAVAKVQFFGSGGILPFGIPAGFGNGGHLCLSDAPAGLALNPCTGGASGNFGTLEGRIFGNPEIPTNQSLGNCNAAPLSDVLARNIAHGYDHIVVTDPDALDSNEVRDECRNPFVDTLNTDTGFPNNGAEEGLIGPVPMDGAFSYTPRLAQSPTTVPIKTGVVDDRPLWQYLNTTADYGGTSLPTSDDAPASCDPATFDNSLPDFDWDGDGILDRPESWQHIDYCIDAYVSGGFTGVMFSDTILSNRARFGYVPEFWADPSIPAGTLGTGNSWLHIKRFRAIYLQTTLWRDGARYVLHSPGEPCHELEPAPGDVVCPTGSTGGNLIQLTAVILPDAALPFDISGQIPGPGGSINPTFIELVK